MLSNHYDILVVDDEKVVIDAVKKICSIENYSVDEATDAESALKKLDKNIYRLIICDIRMPGMEGFEFLEQLTERKIKTPVIMSTGYSTVEYAVKSLYAGAFDFVPKPFTADELLNSVARTLKCIEILTDKSSFEPPYIPCPVKYFRLGYSSWIVQQDDGSVLSGVTNLLVRSIENVKEVVLQNMEEEIFQGTSFLQIISGDNRTHSIYSPLSGRIILRNEELINNPNILEKDPYFSGWIYHLIPNEIEFELKYLIPCSSDRV
jgi:CheY-like chemotaxis protein/glycine cleavage system H lipoate-binding protein